MNAPAEVMAVPVMHSRLTVAYLNGAFSVRQRSKGSDWFDWGWSHPCGLTLKGSCLPNIQDAAECIPEICEKVQEYVLTELLAERVVLKSARPEVTE